MINFAFQIFDGKCYWLLFALYAPDAPVTCILEQPYVQPVLKMVRLIKVTYEMCSPEPVKHQISNELETEI